ncbi:hypothetical protein D9619_007291 [Psilocybe cf. subviscida]|uniref:tRNA-binding domain-containing protein n=1 Tax=Psilocybe cf. subviscida TaxID=2480587 RepID=A0A8H5EWN0_9AGAR|nr:hypothetical protein D9619_007291 [Psilocybe cf. subviscida]
MEPMSFQASVEKLQPPVKALVLSASRNGQDLVGSTPEDEKEVIGWIDKTAAGSLVSENNLKDLDTILVPKVYIATNYLTAADVALYGTLHPIVAKLQSSEYHAVPSITRYFNHLQFDKTVRTAADALSGEFAPVELDIENAPIPERQVAAPKKKEKKDKAPADAPTSTSAAAAPAAETAVDATKEPQQQQKKEKKEKKPKEASSADAGTSKKEKPAGGKGAKAPAADEGEPVPSMIDLRVGHIVDIMKHPDADGLYVEFHQQIDIGEETGPRTVVSGLVNYIPIEQMRDKYLVAVCNLKPASMRGVKSFAMVLCATSKDGKEGGIELIQPPPGSKPGDRIFFEGAEFENVTPLPQLNPKKKIFETVQPGFITLDTKEAAWVNPVTKTVHKMKSEKGVCVAPTSTPNVHKVFSIIGREPIKFPPSVTLTPSPTQLSISGPLGTTAVPLKDYMSIAFPEEHTMKLTVERASEKLQRQMWGTTRTLIANAITGMTEGFTIPLYLVGVGYRVALEDDPRGTTDGGNGQRLNMKLGYSHPVYVPIPTYIKAEVPSATKIVLTCTDKHLIGLFAAKIREYRKPEPYKGKGIFVGNETIRIKSVKKK